MLKRALTTEALRVLFAEGHGGPLVALWALSATSLWLVFHAPWSAALLTLALAAAAVSLAVESLRDAAARARMVASILERALPCSAVRGAPLRGAIGASRAVFLELSTVAARAGTELGIHPVFEAACSILRLQYDAACRAEEHQRVLGLLQPAHASAQTLRALAAEEAGLVVEAGTHLQTLLVQLLQLGSRPGDLIGLERVAEERAEALHYLQARVEAQQQTAAAVRHSMRTRS